MAGLMSRASLVVKSKFSKLLDHAEDPGETLDYSYEKQLELLQNVKRGIADVVTAKKRLELQETQLQQSLVKLDAQAREALAAGREDLARQALERKSGLQQQLQSLDEQTKQLEQQQEKLIASEKTLSAKVEAFRSQKETIKAQYSAAEAQVRIGEAATGIGEQMADTGLAIQRAKDKTEQMQARASAIDELTTSGALEDFTSDQTQLDRELGAIASKSQVDKELEQMKSRARLRREQEGAVAVIVRVMGEGQFEIDDEVAKGLNDLDEQAEQALQCGRPGAAHGAAGADGRGRAHERHASSRRRPVALRGDRPAARPDARGSPRAVRRRGPDPGPSRRLATVTGSRARVPHPPGWG